MESIFKTVSQERVIPIVFQIFEWNNELSQDYQEISDNKIE